MIFIDIFATNMIFVGLLLVIVTVILIIVYRTNRKDRHAKKQIIDALKKYGTIDNRALFPIYTYKEKNYYLYVLRLPSGLKLSFNSATVWETKSRNGKSILHHKKEFAQLKGRKIVIVYPNQGPYLRYEDEHNVTFTKPNEVFWDMHVINSDALEEVLEKGF